MNFEALSKAPPWLIIVLMMLGSGGGGATLNNLFGGGDMAKEMKALNEKMSKVVRKIDSITWRMTAHTDRLNGMSTKNREQDTAISKLKHQVTILDVISTRFPKENGYER